MLKRLLTTITIAVMISASLPATAQEQGENAMSTPTFTDRVAVNGVELHYEIHGEGKPLVMLHGGVNPSDLFGGPLAAMAEAHKVYAIHLRGHGLSTDTDEDWSPQQMADDVDALLDRIGLEQVDFMGWSLGAGVAMQVAIRHPERVGKLVLVGKNIKTSGNFPEVQAAFDDMPNQAATIAGYLKNSPLATLYPDIDWERVMIKSGRMNQGSFDWTEDFGRIKAPTLLVFADADMMYLEHMVEMYRLIGGGTRDAGVNNATRPTANQLAIVPGASHYDVLNKPGSPVADFAKAFLAQ